MGVKADQLGASCTDCYGPLYVVKIQHGPKIGTRVTYRHVERHPACGQSTITVSK